MTPGPSPARDPLITDAEFKTELDIVANEVYEATYIHHTMEEINDLARTDHGILVAMNEQPLFWQAHRAASQAALFMCLGRIFDTDDATSSIHRLIRITRVNLHVFEPCTRGAKDGVRTETVLVRQFHGRSVGTSDSGGFEVSQGRA